MIKIISRGGFTLLFFFASSELQNRKYLSIALKGPLLPAGPARRKEYSFSLRCREILSMKLLASMRRLSKAMQHFCLATTTRHFSPTAAEPPKAQGLVLLGSEQRQNELKKNSWLVVFMKSRRIFIIPLFISNCEALRS